MLQAKFQNIMRRELESQRLQLNQYCQQRIEQLVGHAVQRLHVSKAADNASYLMRAERNLRSLVKYLADYARKVDTFPTLGNTHFDAAMRECPTYWPFVNAG